MKKYLEKLGLLSVMALSAVQTYAQDPTFSETMTNQATAAIEDVESKIGPVLIAAFAITVAFVCYKLIKRAVNKA